MGWHGRAMAIVKKAGMMRFVPTAPQRLCPRTKCRASGGKGLVSRRDAEAQRGWDRERLGSFASPCSKNLAQRRRDAESDRKSEAWATVNGITVG